MEDKQPIPPEDAYPELEDEADEKAVLEDLVSEEGDISPAIPERGSQVDDATQAKLQHDLEVLRNQLKEKEEGFVRLYADFENFRRRTQREKEELGLKEKQKVLADILPIVDNFERAQQQVRLETDREREIHNSYQSVYRQLVEALKRLGVSRLKSVGQPFDPNLHEAIARQPSSEYPEDAIVQEYQPGYKLGDVVIRHAMVMVSSGPAEEGSTAQPTPPDEDGSVANPTEEG